MTEELKRYYRDLEGKKVFFLGAGISHRDLIRRFVKEGAKVTLCDMKSLEQLGDFGRECVSMGVDLCLGEGYLDHLKEADRVFRTPGIDWTKPEIQNAVEAGVEVTSEMESFFDLCPCRIIGVTGSDGKTTTTTLIARTMEAAGFRVHLGGNIGTPLFPIIDDVMPEDVAVVELSSFQLISMKKSPSVSVVTNVTPNHLDHHKDMDEYVGAKKNIYRWQSGDTVSVFNAANEITRQMATEAKGEIRWFSRYGEVGNGAYVSADSFLISTDHGTEHVVMDLKGIRLRGEHNKENVATAYCAVKGFVPDEVFAKTVSGFTGVEHRIEFVRELDGVSYFNDSIASSPTRTIAGLRSFEEPIVLIAGGYDKKISYAPLAPEIIGNNVKAVILCGDTADSIESELRKCEGFSERIVIRRQKDVPECVAAAREIAEKGDVVLFSPASASFDMYSNFEERGRHFKKIVKELD